MEMLTIVSDGLIKRNGQVAKELSVPAYAIGKTLAVTNAKLRTSLAKAITFYGGKARQVVAAKKRVTNAGKRAAKAAKKSAATRRHDLRICRDLALFWHGGVPKSTPRR